MHYKLWQYSKIVPARKENWLEESYLAYLLIIVLEIFFFWKYYSNINGLKISSHRYLYTAYAYDTSLFL